MITGDGKGKSTSGFGTVCRAVGHGLKAAVVQFIKGNWACGERNLLSSAGVEFHVMATGFTWETQDRQADTLAAQAVWQEAKRLLADPDIQLVLLDELTYMVAYDYLDLDEVLEALVHRPAMQHVVITGRGCHRGCGGGRRVGRERAGHRAVSLKSCAVQQAGDAWDDEAIS